MTTSPIRPTDLLIRHDTIAGLRALADFLEANPAVPVRPFGDDYSVFTTRTDDTAERAAIDHLAELLGVIPQDDTDGGGHYTAIRHFGPIAYRAVHIPEAARRGHEAVFSYAANLDPRPAPTDEPDGVADSERAA
jgi:hypothetical protein